MHRNQSEKDLGEGKGCRCRLVKGKKVRHVKSSELGKVSLQPRRRTRDVLLWFLLSDVKCNWWVVASTLGMLRACFTSLTATRYQTG